MTIYIALLRGINVGGRNKVNMTDLKQMLGGMGFNRVATYINSGNVIFEAAEGAGSAESISLRIEEQIKTVLGATSPVVLRTAEQFERLMNQCPYSTEELSEGETIQTLLLSEPPTERTLELLSANIGGIDEYHISGQNIYFLYRQPILDSNLAKSIQKMKQVNTMRNWNTMMKLAEMAQKMQAEV